MTQESAHELPAGHKLGRYEIEAPISKGAMGAVYRARNAVSGERVAVKRLFDPRHAARFEIEARLLSQLEHPRVVRVVDHFQDGSGAYYLVMQLIQGTDLGALLKMLWPTIDRRLAAPSISAVPDAATASADTSSAVGGDDEHPQSGPGDERSWEYRRSDN